MSFPSIRVHTVDDDDDDSMPDVADQFSRLGTQDDDFGSTVTPTRGNRFVITTPKFDSIRFDSIYWSPDDAMIQVQPASDDI